jgi:predicted ribosomally synthesized peptide with SipW-like signal peptide
MLSRRTHRLLRAAGAVLGSAVAAGLVTSGTLAAFTATSQSTGNLITAKADWVGPNVNAVVASKGTGLDGYVRPGGTYRVYADVPTDSGAPPSGTKSVVSDVTGLTSDTGSDAAPLAGGTFALGGHTYTHRSATLTVDPATPEGVRTFTLTAIDNDDNQTVRLNLPVTVDATPPATTDVQATDHAGGTPGRAEADDVITYTFSERVEPETILAGWDGTPDAATVRLVDTPSGDELRVYDGADATLTALGTLELGGTDFTTSDVKFTDSTIAMSTAAPWTVTVTLGAASAATTAQATHTTGTWIPQAGITDVAGNALPTTGRTETGSADVDF